jgi:hypothetical protein
MRNLQKFDDDIVQQALNGTLETSPNFTAILKQHYITKK